MIRLTRYDSDRAIYVNPSMICTVYDKSGRTYVDMVNDSDDNLGILVKESAAQVVKLIRAAVEVPR